MGTHWPLVTRYTTMMLYLLLLAGAGHGLVPTYPRVMTGDLENCHIFYQSDTPNPAPMSCGEMMFNTETQVCDWPHIVIQKRPECRNIEQVVFQNSLESPFLQRTVRMLSLYESPVSSGDPQRDELTKRIFLEIQRRLPELLNRKITHYVSSLNTVNDVYVDRSHDDYSEGKPESLVHDYYEDYDYKQYIPVTTTQTTTTTEKSTTTTTATTTTTTPKPTSSTVRTVLTFNTAALPRLRRPQPTPFHQIPRNLETGHYTYQHQYNSQVTEIDADTHREPIVGGEGGMVTTTRPPPVTTHTFTSDPDNNRRWNVSRKRPLLRNCMKGGNCPKPRRLILRKVRRKLFQNERDRLQERRKELNPDSEYDIYTNDLRTEAPEKKAGGNGIEGDQGVKSHQSYGGDGAIEKLKSLIREKQFANEKPSSERSGKIVSVTYTTSSN